MAVVKSVTIDGESIHVFRNAVYIFESSSGFTLELDLIVSEVVVKKYKTVDNLIVAIELEDGRIIHSIMHVKILSGGLPQLNLFSDLDDIQEYTDFDRVSENDSWFPNIEDGITIEEIRKVEMPHEDVSIKLKLPINQIEWIKKQKKKSLNEIFQEMINEYWEKQDIK
ncbi:hypothetical protein G6549_16060 [Bacillus sp. MM2020_1]|nr:hypothetical protein [Bacillus sp. MM2020_1]